MKTAKFFTLIASIASIICLSSCKKENKTPNVFITADVNGVPTSFSTSAAAFTAMVNGETNTAFYGKSADGTEFHIIIGNALTSGTTYTADQAHAYQQPQMILVVTGNIDYTNDLSFPTNPVTISVTTNSATAVSGTFNGELIENTHHTGEKKSLTNGKFYLLYKPYP
ncbi:hypothetical protein [Mucilaginibacter ginsenosidivorans]|uniref:Uncharacterized protein n=1 Tax=Mucilaginibacter ginsenosidivorans TaxID=398053 RepID=A0A5B8V1L1_9SPHI|nr:hypothetical protein [Mucilaginibacter ginsenosidivorans]QEC65058.1 hypothetical protein FRZ54_21615 [Mucilaginibacter ginsenosidivorans]